MAVMLQGRERDARRDLEISGQSPLSTLNDESDCGVSCVLFIDYM